jgi:hypothetical protein
MRTLKFTKFAILVAVVAMFATSCTTIDKAMREPNVRVDLTKSDFTLSDQVSAEATTTKIIGIDFSRLTMKKTGQVKSPSQGISIANLPVIGNMLGDKTSNYALYELLNSNPDYDVIFYPQYEITVEKPVLGIGFFTKKTTTKVTARLGKLKK